jgi:hypothetical protein
MRKRKRGTVEADAMVRPVVLPAELHARLKARAVDAGRKLQSLAAEYVALGLSIPPATLARVEGERLRRQAALGRPVGIGETLDDLLSASLADCAAGGGAVIDVGGTKP